MHDSDGEFNLRESDRIEIYSMRHMNPIKDPYYSSLLLPYRQYSPNWARDHFVLDYILRLEQNLTVVWRRWRLICWSRRDMLEMAMSAMSVKECAVERDRPSNEVCRVFKHRFIGSLGGQLVEWQNWPACQHHGWICYWLLLWTAIWSTAKFVDMIFAWRARSRGANWKGFVWQRYSGFIYSSIHMPINSSINLNLTLYSNKAKKGNQTVRVQKTSPRSHRNSSTIRTQMNDIWKESSQGKLCRHWWGR